MHIYIVKGKGTGRTLLSAFDHALQDAGICNYNLITLSSIIPPRSHIILQNQYHTPTEEFGHKLYLVKAEKRSQKKDQYIGAGIGWYQLDDGRGFFVEHELQSQSFHSAEVKIQRLIIDSIQDLCLVRGIHCDADKIQMTMVITQVKKDPTCALVLAVYQSERWSK